MASARGDTSYQRFGAFMIAASDYLFYHIPEENVIALCEAANQSRE